MLKYIDIGMLCVRYLFRTPIRRYMLINHLTIIFPAISRHLLVPIFLLKIKWSIREQYSVHVKLNENHDSLFRFFQKMILFIIYLLPLDQQEWRIEFDFSSLLPVNDEQRTLISCWFLENSKTSVSYITFVIKIVTQAFSVAFHLHRLTSCKNIKRSC